MPSELDALRAAKLPLDQHGTHKARRIVLPQAFRQHTANHTGFMAITLGMPAALDKVTLKQNGKTHVDSTQEQGFSMISGIGGTMFKIATVSLMLLSTSIVVGRVPGRGVGGGHRGEPG